MEGRCRAKASGQEEALILYYLLDVDFAGLDSLVLLLLLTEGPELLALLLL